MPLQDISYLQLWQPACLAEQNHLGNIGRGHYEEHFRSDFLHLDQDCTYHIEGVCGCLADERVSFYPNPVIS